MNPLQYEFPFDFTDMPTLEEREAATGLQWGPDGERVKFVTEEQALQARVSALLVQSAMASASFDRGECSQPGLLVPVNQAGDAKSRCGKMSALQHLQQITWGLICPTC